MSNKSLCPVTPAGMSQGTLNAAWTGARTRRQRCHNDLVVGALVLSPKRGFWEITDAW